MMSGEKQVKVAPIRLCRREVRSAEANFFPMSGEKRRSKSPLTDKTMPLNVRSAEANFFPMRPRRSK